MTPRMTGLQAFALSLLGLLDSAQRGEPNATTGPLLNILAARLARDFVREYWTRRSKPRESTYPASEGLAGHRGGDRVRRLPGGGPIVARRRSR